MAEIKKDFARGNRISEKRKKLGMSQDEMAERIGICRQALSAIENGGAFKTQTLEKLVSVLGTSERYILHGNDTDCKLITEVMALLQGMDELQLRQCLAMIKAMKSVAIEK